MSTLVCLVSKQLAANYIAAKHFQPDNIVLCYTDDTEQDLRLLEKALQRGGFPTLKFHKIEPFDLQRNLVHARNLLSTLNPGSQVILNYTGGTKQMSIPFFQIWLQNKLPSTYIDAQNELIWKSVDGKMTSEPFRIPTTVNDILALTDHPIDVVRDATRITKRNSLTRMIAEIKLRAARTGKVNTQFESFLKSAVDAQIYGKMWKGGKVDRLIEVTLSNDGVLVRANTEEWWFSVDEHTGYFAGRWLEEHVFLTLKEARTFDDVQCGVQVLFAPEDKKSVRSLEEIKTIAPLPMNEIDVACAHNGKIFCIECKSGTIIQSDVDKCRIVATALGGKYATPIIVALGTGEAQKRRCRELGIRIVLADEIRGLIAILQSEEHNVHT